MCMYNYTALTPIQILRQYWRGFINLRQYWCGFINLRQYWSRFSVGPRTSQKTSISGSERPNEFYTPDNLIQPYYHNDTTLSLWQIKLGLIGVNLKFWGQKIPNSFFGEPTGWNMEKPAILDFKANQWPIHVGTDISQFFNWRRFSKPTPISTEPTPILA